MESVVGYWYSRFVLERGLALLYLLFKPLPFGAMNPWNPPTPPPATGPYAPNNLLAGVTPLDLGGHVVGIQPFDKATELAGKAYASGKGILEIIREEKVLTEAQIQDLLDPVKLTNLDRSLYPPTP